MCFRPRHTLFRILQNLLWPFSKNVFVLSSWKSFRQEDICPFNSTLLPPSGQNLATLFSVKILSLSVCDVLTNPPGGDVLGEAFGGLAEDVINNFQDLLSEPAYVFLDIRQPLQESTNGDGLDNY